MRTIKTALAVSICVLVSRLFNVTTAFYACIAAIISMESTVVYSYRAGVNRILGTVLGAFIGLVFSYIRPGDVILSGIGIVIVITLCNLFKWKKSIAIASTVFCIIMTNLQGRNPLQYSVYRTLDTLLGIVIAVIVNFTIFPPKVYENINEKYKILKDICINEFISVVKIHGKVDLNRIKEGLNGFDKYIQLYEEEFEIIKNNHYDLKTLKIMYSNFEKIYVYLEMISFINSECIVNETNLLRLKQFIDIDESSLLEKYNSNIYNEENILFNYNVSKIMDCFLIISNLEKKEII